MPRYFTFIRGAENQGAPPKALMDAMEKFIGESLQNGSLVSTGGLTLSPHIGPALQGGNGTGGSGHPSLDERLAILN